MFRNEITCIGVSQQIKTAELKQTVDIEIDKTWINKIKWINKE